MQEHAGGFDSLLSLFRQPSRLPILPSTVYQLGMEIRTNEMTTDLVESLIAGEPDLLASFRQLSLAHGVEPGQDDLSWIRPAILLIGISFTRHFILAAYVLQIVQTQSRHCLYDSRRASRDVRCTGLLAECLFSQDALDGVHTEPGYYFANAVLRELPFALLASGAPGVYNRLHLLAEEKNIGLREAFEELFGRKPAILGYVAWHAWDLPLNHFFVQLVEGSALVITEHLQTPAA